jgi:hypothetical protein
MLESSARDCDRFVVVRDCGGTSSLSLNGGGYGAPQRTTQAAMSRQARLSLSDAYV